jgi:hypothetical protein
MIIRTLLFSFLFLPFAMQAQLDRVRTDMTEAEFIKAVPEAVRDYDKEAAWVHDSVEVAGISGEATHRFYRDTVVAYHFTSKSVHGPSEEYPRGDSTNVHRMKSSAEAIKKVFEIEHGKPQQFWNTSLTAPNPMNNAVVYLAQWSDSKDQIIRISIIAQSVHANHINGPAISSVPPFESYELNIVVTMPAKDTYSRYGIGQPSEVFFLANSALLEQGSFRNNHIYSIVDSATSPNAHWTFVFVKDQLATMEYSAYIGSQYGANDDATSYSLARTQALKIHAQSKKTLGKNDTLDNHMPDKYTVHARNVAYSEMWFYGDWIPKGGYAVLQLMEIGGGKNPATTFAVTFYYEKRD